MSDQVIYEDNLLVSNAYIVHDVTDCEGAGCEAAAIYVVGGTSRNTLNWRRRTFRRTFRRHLCADCGLKWAALHGLAFPPKQEEDE